MVVPGLPANEAGVLPGGFSKTDLFAEGVVLVRANHADELVGQPPNLLVHAVVLGAGGEQVRRDGGDGLGREVVPQDVADDRGASLWGRVLR